MNILCMAMILLKKEEKNRAGILKGFPATSWVINFNWSEGE